MLDSSVIREAVRREREEASTIDAILTEQTGLAPEDVLREMGRAFHYQVSRLENDADLRLDLEALGLPDCRRRQALVISQDGAQVLLFVNPTDDGLQRWADAKGIAVGARQLVLESEFLSALGRIEGAASALPQVLGDAFSDDVRRVGVEEISLARIDGTASPVIRLINSTLFDAMGAGASDVHLEAAASGLVVKYRIDGVITVAARVSGVELTEKAISRVKVMAELDITERRIPQDGRFKARIRDRDIDFRVSIMPSIFGEDAVIRILHKDHLSDQIAGLTLDRLGFDANSLTVIRRLAREPHGMLLITGPTGSGKTTTLYAAISEINDGASKIITIEDPVEYQVPGVLQIPVNERKGLTVECQPELTP